MPDHLHLLITPALDVSLEKAMQFIKGNFSYRLGKEAKVKVWLESFTNHSVRDAEDYEKHRSYIQLNPMRGGGDKSVFGGTPHPSDWTRCHRG